MSEPNKPRTRAEYFTQRECCVQDDLRSALKWAYFYSRRQQLSPQLRKEVQDALIDSVVLAEREAAACGPTFVVSAAERARRERVDSAKQYANATARDAMRLAGFGPEDYERSLEEWDTYIRDEIRRQLTELGKENLADEID